MNLFDPELQLINTEPITKKKLKALLADLKKFKVHSVLVFQYKKRNDCKISHSSVKIIASDSDTDEALKSMHQSIVTNIKHSASKGCVVIETIIKHVIKIFEC